MKTYVIPEYLVERDEKRCIRCKVCVNQCTYDTHFYDQETDSVCSKDENCVNCMRCVTFCPTHAITIKKNPNANRSNANWTFEAIQDVKKQAEDGAVLLTGMGNDKPSFTYWDRLLLNASQVTNPSIDPLREPMEIRTYLGTKPDSLDFKIASGMVRAGADIIAIDGVRGATGAAPKVIRDNVGIPIELALAQIDQRLREEGIRNQASVVAAGGIRSSCDVIKAIALGADAVYIGTAALIAVGCTVCQRCYTGKCPWGIATSDPWISKRINPDIASKRLINLLHSWSVEIKDMMGGMGINAIESLRGNRLALRGVGLSRTELKILGVKMAGE